MNHVIRFYGQLGVHLLCCIRREGFFFAFFANFAASVKCNPLKYSQQKQKILSTKVGDALRLLVVLYN